MIRSSRLDFVPTGTGSKRPSIVTPGILHCSSSNNTQRCFLVPRDNNNNNFRGKCTLTRFGSISYSTILGSSRWDSSLQPTFSDLSSGWWSKTIVQKRHGSSLRRRKRRRHSLSRHRLRIKNINRSLDSARKLLDKLKHPEGCFTRSTFSFVRTTFNTMIKQKCRGQSTMELMLKLFERSIFELRLAEYQGPAAWLCEPKYYNPLLELWANASTNKRKKLTKAIKVLEKLRKFKLVVPSFRYNRDTMQIIMKTLIRQGPKSERPFVADYVLREIQKEAVKENRPDLMPDSKMYDYVLLAWRRSVLPRAGGEMKELLQRMREEDGVVPTGRSYAILLRWHARHTNVKELEELLEEMRINDIQHTTTSWSYAFRCFWNNDQIEKAEKSLRLMIAEQPESSDEVGLIADCTQVLFQTWAEMVSNTETELETKEQYLQHAEDIYSMLRHQNWLDIQEKLLPKPVRLLLCLNEIRGKTAEAYMQCNQNEKGTDVNERIQKSLTNFILWKIRFLGRREEQNRGTAILNAMIKSQYSKPFIEHFNAVFEAWGNSPNKRHAPPIVQELFDHLEFDPESNSDRVRPNTETFRAVLKVHANSKQKIALKRSAQAINKMRRFARSTANTSVELDSMTYFYAVKIHLRFGYFDRALRFLDDMDAFGAKLPADIFDDMEEFWSEIQRTWAKERGEVIMGRLQSLVEGKTASADADDSFSIPASGFVE